MMTGPKFRVGQSVYIKDQVDYYIKCHNRKYDTYGNPIPRSVTIVGVLIEECSGGFRIYYRLSLVEGLVNELSLVGELPNLSTENK